VRETVGVIGRASSSAGPRARRNKAAAGSASRSSTWETPPGAGQLQPSKDSSQLTAGIDAGAGDPAARSARQVQGHQIGDGQQQPGRVVSSCSGQVPNHHSGSRQVRVPARRAGEMLASGAGPRTSRRTPPRSGSPRPRCGSAGCPPPAAGRRSLGGQALPAQRDHPPPPRGPAGAVRGRARPRGGATAPDSRPRCSATRLIIAHRV